MQAVSHWETGRSLEIDAAHLFKVADVLGVSARWLSSEEGPRDKTEIEREIDRLPAEKRQLVLDLVKTLGNR